MKVKLVSEHVITPSSPTPSHLRDYKLSFIDEIIPHSYFHIILYYSTGQKNNFQEISLRLRNSLSETLTDFYPLAGRINGQTSIDCNDEGVRYSEATVDDDYSLSDLIEFPDVSVLNELIPCKSSGNVSPDTEVLLAVQVSFFSCGGIALGICQSHRIADGFSLCNFIKAWAEYCNNYAKYSSQGTRKRQRTIIPVFDSAKFLPPRNTPNFKPNPKNPALLPPDQKIGTKRFKFDSTTLDFLKEKVINESPKANPSRVDIVSALIWKTWMDAVGMIGGSETSIAFQPVNLRGRSAVPSLTEYTFGNIFQMAKTETNGEENWMELVEKLKEGVREIGSEQAQKLVGENGSEICRRNFKEVSEALSREAEGVRVLRYSSWCGFQLQGVDFGWGNAVWVSNASFCCKNHVFLLDSVEEDDYGIEAWMNMDDKEMPKFEQALLEFHRNMSKC